MKILTKILILKMTMIMILVIILMKMLISLFLIKAMIINLSMVTSTYNGYLNIIVIYSMQLQFYLIEVSIFLLDLKIG